MRSTSGAAGQDPVRPSFIEEARRTQIAEAAIRLIAARGFARTSLVEVAREAGCSKGVILYHFKGKRDLVQEILVRLLNGPGEHIKTAVDAASGAAEKIRAYVRANFDLMKTHRDHYLALVDLWGAHRSAEGRNHFETEAYAPSRRYLSKILEKGRDSGELRGMTLPTMASVIQAAIDGVMLQWVFDPDAVDLDTCCKEIESMISTHIAATCGPPANGQAQEHRRKGRP